MSPFGENTPNDRFRASFKALVFKSETKIVESSRMVTPEILVSNFLNFSGYLFFSKNFHTTIY